ncbi:MAG: ankyrin repeat domain-containing protein, partial [Caulobacter sp.]|nr:ankyrin repeat domain-containing protein [Vitreoscilla sp.]
LRSAPTPLHVAANADDVDALGRLLADPGTRVDAPDALGRTALQVAVAAANVRPVRLLLAAGADPDHADASGATPRSVARTGANAEIATLLAAR